MGDSYTGKLWNRWIVLQKWITVKNWGFNIKEWLNSQQHYILWYLSLYFEVLVDPSLSNSWEANTYGYRSDDGLLYRGRGKGESFDPMYTTSDTKYTTGDTVGGGINYATQEFFFT